MLLKKPVEEGTKDKQKVYACFLNLNLSSELF